MSNTYYREQVPYRSRSPLRPPSPQMSSRYQHYSPPPLTSQHYSPPRNNARPRTPPRPHSPPHERGSGEYPRYPERVQPRRSLPWATQPSPPSPRRPADYPDRDRFREPISPTETRRQYDSYPNPREETFFTQPQRFQSSSADRRSSGSVNEVSDKWTSSHYSPPPRSSNRGPSPILRRASPRDPVNWDRSRSPQGTRDAPIFIEDTPPNRNARRPDDVRNIREPPPQRQNEQAWRPPPNRSRSPIPRQRSPVIPPIGPKVWMEENDRRHYSPPRRQQSPPAFDLRKDSPPPRIPERESFSGDRPRLDPAPAKEAVGKAVFEVDKYSSRGNLERRDIPPRKTRFDQPASGPLQSKPPAFESIRNQSRGPVGVEEYVNSKRPMLEQAQSQKPKSPRKQSPSRTTIRRNLPPPSLAPVPTQTQGRSVSEDEAGPRQLDRRPLPPPIPRQTESAASTHISRPTSSSRVSRSPSRSAFPTRPTSRDKGNPPPKLQFTASPQPRQLPISKPIKRKVKKIAKVTNPQLPRGKENPARAPPVRELDPSNPIPHLTNGEKQQFLSQMATRAAEIWLASNSPQAAATIHQAATALAGLQPGLDLLKNSVTVPSPVPIPIPVIPPIPPAADSVATYPPFPFEQNPLGIMNAFNVGSNPLPKPIPTATSEPLHLHEKLIVHAKLDEPFSEERRRGNSIASSISSNSRTWASPFLAALVTPGTCIVCHEKDKPPRNRLAKCSVCSAIYHQSCHDPAQTRKMLEDAGETWKCKSCITRKVDKENSVEVSQEEVVSPKLPRRVSSLSVTLKSNDEKTLEEQVMVNKYSFTSLLQRHAAEFSNPALQKAVGSTSRSPSLPSPGKKSEEQVNSFSKLKLEHSKSPIDGDVNQSEKGTPISHANSHVDVAVSTSAAPELKDQSNISNLVHKEERRTESSQSVDPTFLEVSSAEAVPAIKPPDKAIPASQSPSQENDPSPNISLLEPESRPVVRPRHRMFKKRDLVISDSEDENPTKRLKLGASPRAAMKSAPSSAHRPPVISRATPFKLPLMSGTPTAKLPIEPAKRSVVAKKSGSKIHGKSESPQPVKGKELDKMRQDMRSPVSPVQTVRRILDQPAPLPETRPTDAGESQDYSLRLILTSGMSKNTSVLVNKDRDGFDYNSPYPAPSDPVRRPAPLSPPQKRSQDKKNFDILSLVPMNAVAVLEEGKLAFREGTFDARTGHLKRGARKFKVGRFLAGEIV